MKPGQKDLDEEEKSCAVLAADAVMIVEWCVKSSTSAAELRTQPMAVILASMRKQQPYKKLRVHPPLPVGRKGVFPGLSPSHCELRTFWQ